MPAVEEKEKYTLKDLISLARQAGQAAKASFNRNCADAKGYGLQLVELKKQLIRANEDTPNAHKLRMEINKRSSYQYWLQTKCNKARALFADTSHELESAVAIINKNKYEGQARMEMKKRILKLGYIFWGMCSAGGPFGITTRAQVTDVKADNQGLDLTQSEDDVSRMVDLYLSKQVLCGPPDTQMPWYVYDALPDNAYLDNCDAFQCYDTKDVVEKLGGLGVNIYQHNLQDFAEVTKGLLPKQVAALFACGELMQRITLPLITNSIQMACGVGGLRPLAHYNLDVAVKQAAAFGANLRLARYNMTEPQQVAGVCKENIKVCNLVQGANHVLRKLKTPKSAEDVLHNLGDESVAVGRSCKSLNRAGKGMTKANAQLCEDGEDCEVYKWGRKKYCRKKRGSHGAVRGRRGGVVECNKEPKISPSLQLPISGEYAAVVVPTPAPPPRPPAPPRVVRGN
jgi:hypothetical protein